MIMPSKYTHSSPRYQVPTRLLQPLWLRSRESFIDDGLVYDPIAARACQRCHLAPDCLAGDIPQKQLLHVTLARLCDQQIHHFLATHPDGWIINVGAGLDTRFYRVDNGRCHWVEVDVSEHLLWRQKLFHRSERYQHCCGSVDNLDWLERLIIPDSAPVLILCEHALLDCHAKQISSFIRALGLHFVNARACLVLAGDKTMTRLGQKMGSGHYQHGFAKPDQAILNALPWAHSALLLSPLDRHCHRWKLWQRLVSKINGFKYRLTPVVVQVRW
ncbi:class I SAM-dependent methyltransferase [Vibrio metschnikovii]|uniref:class I SAM-dependent methyltransferase n=1 Tax=Vibrio metschnikovii TaxID=28172 RepID=UPI001649086A|nr:class I SAM-dependent methyltransferase [Vibrio metschnikovii]MBC3621685.1 class I SAM-dependent methyltransferase [Vibrio metschnikovii]